MSKPGPKRWWRISRMCLRGVRLVVLVLLLIAVSLIAWVNTIGLPGFLKRPLIAKLHERGLDIQFRRLRWRWNRGLVADDVHVGSATQESNNPQISVQQLSLKINHHELVRFRLQIDGVTLRGGNVFWPLAEINQPASSLSITNIQTQLRFLPGDDWTLDNFNAGFAGAKLQVSGTLTNASAIREWEAFRSQHGAHPGLLNQHLRELARVIDQIQFTTSPELSVVINGDARDPLSINGVLTLVAQGATTPWGTLSNGTLFVHLSPPASSNGLPNLKCQLQTEELNFKLHPDSVRTISGDTHHFNLDLDAVGDDTSTNLVHAKIHITANQLATPWAKAANIQLNGHWKHALSNAIPIAGTLDLRLTDATTRWGSAGELQLTASTISSPAGEQMQADASWGWWSDLEPYALDWNCRIENLRVEDFRSSQVVCGGNWRAPDLTITNLHTEMYQGKLDASAGLNVVTRVAHFASTVDFDALKIQPFLTSGARRWIVAQEFEWEKPPLMHGSGSIVLPQWTNAHPNWRGEVLPTFSMAADFKVGAASYRKIPLSSAQGHIYFTNMVWDLPDLVAYRPEGKVELSHLSDDKTKDYYFRFRSTADVKIARHLLAPAAQRGLDSFTFSQPPVINGEVWGRWREHERTGFKGQVAITNFIFRGASATYFHSFLDYTNGFLELMDARLERTNEYLSASKMLIDFARKRAFLTNGYSTMEPMVVLRTIGPHVARDMEPYHFLKPPVIKANGVIPLSSDTSVADLHFDVTGGPFEWFAFHLPQISGNVDWTGELLTLSQIQATFYEGKLTGTAGFDFKRHIGTDFHFDTIVTGANLHSLMSDLTPKTNHLEGTLNAHLDVSYANSVDRRSWTGKGEADLRDGLIWDIPIFGILTPVLDAISPGLGESRASQANGTFIITNSVIRSDDLVIRSPTVTLFYKGTVDFDRKVDAVVDAEVGRNTPLFGSIFGAISAPFGKLFETKVTGNLEHPKSEAVVPFVRWLSPFHWFQFFKDLGEPGNKPPPPK